VIVHLWPLIISLVLLWFPRQWLRLGRKVGGSSRSRRRRSAAAIVADKVVPPRRDYQKPRNWLDFVRALAAGMAVVQCCFEVAAGAPRSADTRIFVLQAAILVVAVLIQAVRFGQGKISLVGPVYFIVGLSFGLIGWKAAVFACVVGLILHEILPGGPGLFLFAFAALEVGFALMFSPAPRGLILLAIGLAMIPIVLSGVLKQSVVRLDKQRKTM
jgi:hypothetical protein